MKVKYSILSLLVAGCALSGRGLDLTTYNQWFSFSLNEYEAGQLLSDVGAENASWGSSPIPQGVGAIVSVNQGTKELDIVNACGDGPSLTADRVRTASSSTCIRSRVSFPESESVPPAQANWKAAMSMTTKRDGSAAFMGYTGEGWVELTDPTGAIKAKFNHVYDTIAVFTGGLVSYYISEPGSDGILLVSVENVNRSTFPLNAANNQFTLGALELFGNGALYGIDGYYRALPINIRAR